MVGITWGVHDARGGWGVLDVLLAWFAVVSFRHRPAGPAGTPLAMRSGFTVLLVALASGAATIARGVVLIRTGRQKTACHSTASLKPLHGVGLRAVLVLPSLAWLLSRSSWSERVCRWILSAAVVCYVATVAAAGAGWSSRIEGHVLRIT